MRGLWPAAAARVIAGIAVGLAVGLLYDRNVRASAVSARTGIDWGAVVAAALTLGSLLALYEVLAWLLRLTQRRFRHRGRASPPDAQAR